MHKIKVICILERLFMSVLKEIVISEDNIECRDSAITLYIKPNYTTLGFDIIDDIQSVHTTSLSSNQVTSSNIICNTVYADNLNISSNVDIDFMNANICSITRAIINVLSTENQYSNQSDIINLQCLSANIDDITSSHIASFEFKSTKDQILSTIDDDELITKKYLEQMITANLNLILENFDGSHANFDLIYVQQANIANGYINTLVADYTTISNLQGSFANIDTISTQQANIANGYINTLVADYTTISNLHGPFANIDTISTQQANIVNGYINNLVADYTTISNLQGPFANIDTISIQQANIANGYINTLVADYTTISNLHGPFANIDTISTQQANIVNGYINNLVADYTTISNLQGPFANIDTISIQQANIANGYINTLVADYTTISNLHGPFANIDTISTQQANIVNGYINNLVADYTTISNLQGPFANIDTISIQQANIANGYINTLVADYTTISNLNGSFANINTIQSSFVSSDRFISAQDQTLYHPIDEELITKKYLNETIVANVNSILQNINGANINATYGNITNLLSSYANIDTLVTDTITSFEFISTKDQIKNIPKNNELVTKEYVIDYVSNASDFLGDEFKDLLDNNGINVDDIVANVTTNIIKAEFATAQDLANLEANINAIIGDNGIETDIIKTNTIETKYNHLDLDIKLDSISQFLKVYSPYDTDAIFSISGEGECTASMFTCPSDKNLKNTVSKICNPTELLKNINGYSFKWNNKPNDDRIHYGFIAQEVENVLPSMVYTNHSGIKSVDYSKFCAILLEDNKHKDLRIQKLESSVHYLESTIYNINHIISKLTNTT